MALPFIAAAAAIGLGMMGIKKGMDAKSKNDEARDIIEEAKERFEEVKEEVEIESEDLRNKLEEYGELKIKVFNEVVGHFLELMKECANTTNSAANIKKYISQEELQQLEETNVEATEIASSLAKGVASGAVTAFGVYGTVGALASASTGVAIAELSGAAATNATLAWLGGGSLASGGLGVAGGTAVLGGLVAGPAIAVAGFVLDSKAEENLTKAYRFRKDVEIKVEKMLYSLTQFNIAKSYIEESTYLINKFIEKYSDMYHSLINERDKLYTQMYQEYLKEKEKFEKSGVFIKLLNLLMFKKKPKEPIKPPVCQLENISSLIQIVVSLKKILEAPLMDIEGNVNKQFIEIVETVELEHKGVLNG